MAPLGDAHDPRTWRTDVSHLDGLNTAVVAADATGRVVHCNSAAESFLGSTRDRMLCADVVELLLPADHHGAGREVFAHAMAAEPWAGQLPMVDPSGSPRTVEVSASPLRRQGVVVGVLYVLEDATTGIESRGRADRVAARLTRLAKVTAELVYAEDLQTVSRIVVSHAADVIGATVASLARRTDDDTLTLVGIRGTTDELASKYATVPVDGSTPIGEAVRSRTILTLTGRDEIVRNFPDLQLAADGERTMVALPLNVGSRTIGAIGLSFPGHRTFNGAEQEFLRILSDICAQSMDRIQALADAEDRARKLAFLAQAEVELASSLDYRTTLQKVAWIGVPDFADWCTISLLEDGDLRTLEVAHVDPAKVELVRELQLRYPPDQDAPHGSWNVIRTGRAELIPLVTDEILSSVAQDEEHLRLIRALQVHSAVVAPLVAHGKILGVMSWVSTTDGNVFTQSDLDFVADFAKRAAVAIDNAQLHSETREAAVRLQRAVLPERLEPLPGWELASYYSPSGRTEVGGDFYDVLPLGDEVALFVGDVMGRGVDAAAAMAQMRAAVRSYVAVDAEPAAVLSKLDTMFQMFDYTQLVTLIYVLADPSRDRLTMVNAGHPPPVLLHADGTLDELSGFVTAPLGVGPVDRTAFEVTMPPGDTLLLYTDGLIERRDEDIDIGQKRLAAACPSILKGDLQSRLAALVEEVRDHTREDDVAAIAARRLS